VTATDLMAVIPNPMHGESAVSFTLAARGNVDLSIFSVDGRRVKTLAHGVHEIGRYQIKWNGADESGSIAGPGVYYVRFEALGIRRTRLVTLMR